MPACFYCSPKLFGFLFGSDDQDLIFTQLLNGSGQFFQLLPSFDRQGILVTDGFFQYRQCSAIRFNSQSASPLRSVQRGQAHQGSGDFGMIRPEGLFFHSQGLLVPGFRRTEAALNPAQHSKVTQGDRCVNSRTRARAPLPYYKRLSKPGFGFFMSTLVQIEDPEVIPYLGLPRMSGSECLLPVRERSSIEWLGLLV